jgi:hypothetical protein
VSGPDLTQKLKLPCLTGQREAVNRTAGRIVTLTAYVTSLVIFVAYSASLISSLAVQHRDLPFRDLQGLLYDGSYTLGVLQNSSNLNIFDVSNSVSFRVRDKQ